MRQLYGAFYGGLGQALAAHDKFEVYAGEDFWIGFGTFGRQLDLAVRDLVAPAFQDQYNVVGGAAAGTGQQHFHGAGGQIVAAPFRGAVHGGNVAAARAGDKEHAVGAAPVDGAFHECRSG